MAVKSKSIFATGEFRTSLTIVRVMSSTPIAFGSGMSYFEASCHPYKLNLANRSLPNSSKRGVM